MIRLWGKYFGTNNTNPEGLKLLGFVFMLIDHIGVILYPEIVIFRVVGRLAFPIFAYQLVRGFYYTSDINKYLVRLLILAIISQLPYAFAFNTNKLNIFFELALALLFLKKVIKERKLVWGFLIIALICVLRMDYGVYGILTVLAFNLLRENKVLSITLLIVLNLAYGLLFQSLMQLFSLLSLVVIFLEDNLPRIRINKTLAYFFYPIHILTLLLIRFSFQ